MRFVNKLSVKNPFRHHGMKLNDRRKEAVATLEKELSKKPSDWRRWQIAKELAILKERIK